MENSPARASSHGSPPTVPVREKFGCPLCMTQVRGVHSGLQARPLEIQAGQAVDALQGEAACSALCIKQRLLMRTDDVEWHRSTF